ncbi:MAG: hypothetical protein ISF22_11245, partial [Methanomassiliicoccus sp.]|nr:hypothetical protein [Methanomassiliicoccus sp.]
MGEKDDLRQLMSRTMIENGKAVDLKDHPTSWKDPERFTVDGLRLSKENADELVAISQKR